MDKTRTKFKTVIKPVALAPVLTGTLLETQIASAQNNAPPATATRQATTPPDSDIHSQQRPAGHDNAGQHRGMKPSRR
jgi:hypothetical protein